MVEYEEKVLVFLFSRGRGARYFAGSLILHICGRKRRGESHWGAGLLACSGGFGVWMGLVGWLGWGVQRLFVGSGIVDGVECLGRRSSRRGWLLVGIGL